MRRRRCFIDKSSHAALPIVTGKTEGGTVVVVRKRDLVIEKIPQSKNDIWRGKLVGKLSILPAHFTSFLDIFPWKFVTQKFYFLLILYILFWGAQDKERKIYKRYTYTYMEHGWI